MIHTVINILLPMLVGGIAGYFLCIHDNKDLFFFKKHDTTDDYMVLKDLFEKLQKHTESMYKVLVDFQTGSVSKESIDIVVKEYEDYK